MLASVAASTSSRLTLVVPKVESAADVGIVDRLVRGALAERSADPVQVRLDVLVESAAALRDLHAILAGSELVRAVVVGYADLGADLGRHAGEDPTMWDAVRHQVVAAARAAGRAVLDGPWLYTAADAAFIRDRERARAFGFEGTWVIHPAQVAEATRVFTPSPGRGGVGSTGTVRSRSVGLRRRGSRCSGGADARRGGGGPRALGPRPGGGRAGTVIEARGPYFEELEHGQVFDTAPAVTLTSGGAALHQAILGDRLAVATDHEFGRRVSGRGPLVHPAYVWDVSIGQSTLATQFVRANLFYRGLAFRRLPMLGDTLTTVTTVVGLKQNSPRPGRPLTGLAALRITTVDQDGAPVLDFHRCAMLPLSPGVGATEHADDLAQVGVDTADDLAVLDSLDLGTLPRRSGPPAEGSTLEPLGGDVVSSAPELARLTLNIAQVHHDRRAAGGRRLVYGGHTIGIAAAQASRALPGVLLFLGWRSCDHTGPVYEGDTLRSRLEVESVRPGPRGTHVLALRSLVEADAADGSAQPRPVLDWRFTVLA